MKRIIISLLLLVSFSLLYLGCKKDDDKPDETIIRETSNAMFEMEDFLEVVQQALVNDSLMKDSTLRLAADNCVKDSINKTAKVIVLTFNNSTCTDGRVRSGKITIRYTGAYQTDSTIIRIIPEDYTVNGVKIEGVKVITNLGKVSAGSDSIKYSVAVGGNFNSDSTGVTDYLKLVYADKSYTTWKSNVVRIWTAGMQTTWLFDDVYLLNGNFDGATRLGSTYSGKLVNNVEKLGCWAYKIFCPTSGTFTINTSSEGEKMLDFGTGACDKQATVTNQGHTYTIELR